MKLRTAANFPSLRRGFDSLHPLHYRSPEIAIDASSRDPVVAIEHVDDHAWAALPFSGSPMKLGSTPLFLQRATTPASQLVGDAPLSRASTILICR
ncbi:hypothetical protein [uncultured Sphingomonas sp.]|uniref:hypothetical protein n=1 Tax=uncultured Sphingomonas sp. TaxID=158754 RepID=UPI0030F64D73